MIQWQYFPISTRATPLALAVVAAFEAVGDRVDSSKFDLPSDEVLALVGPHLAAAGFSVEIGKKAEQKIDVPVLFGRNGKLEKKFDADAFHQVGEFVVEVEAGRGVINNQFLKDLFQACMMHDVFYLAIAVRNLYKGRQDFEIVCRFLSTL